MGTTELLKTFARLVMKFGTDSRVVRTMLLENWANLEFQELARKTIVLSRLAMTPKPPEEK